MAAPRFTRVTIGELQNDVADGQMNTLLSVGDLNRDGLPDVFLSGRNGQLAWFENPGTVGPWKRHLVDHICNQECGGLAYDLNGSGYPDIINGGDWRSDELSWWENPGPAAFDAAPWKRHIIAKTGKTQFHDELLGSILPGGERYLFFWNQGGGTLYYAPLPSDPYVSPWPDIQVIASGMYEQRPDNQKQPEEGLALADLDGDGQNELIAGTHWYKYNGQSWEQHKYAGGYISTMLAAGDIDSDGRVEILASEGDACIYGKPQGGKFSWFKPVPDITALWEEHVVEDFMLDPHSLQLGDICGNGHLDALVGEIGVKETFLEKKPRLLVFENDGRGNFTRHVIDEGTGTHHAKLVDLRNKGVLDIVSRPLHGPEKWQVFAWYNNAAR